MNKTYTIQLEGQNIGTTALEKADAPMGVVFGLITFNGIDSGYEFFKKYCTATGISITDYPDDCFIQTLDIPQLKVYSDSGTEIKGAGTHISGMDAEGFEINILGITSRLYQEEFSHHVEQYQRMLDEK